jgi:hypothetical protein
LGKGINEDLQNNINALIRKNMLSAVENDTRKKTMLDQRTGGYC